MPSWCGAYTPAYDYSYGYDYGDYGPDVGFGYGYGPGYYGGGYGYARRYGFHGGHRLYGGQPGGFASAHMGAIGGTRFVPGNGGANVSRMGAAHIAGGFHGGVGGGHIGGGLRMH
jgi:hypothetical protein